MHPAFSTCSTFLPRKLPRLWRYSPGPNAPRHLNCTRRTHARATLRFQIATAPNPKTHASAHRTNKAHDRRKSRGKLGKVSSTEQATFSLGGGRIRIRPHYPSVSAVFFQQSPTLFFSLSVRKKRLKISFARFSVPVDGARCGCGGRRGPFAGTGHLWRLCHLPVSYLAVS